MRHLSRLAAVLVVFECGCSRLALDDPGGSGGGGPAGPPPPLLEHPVISLVSAVGGPGRALVAWRAHAPAANLPEFAVFVGSDPASVYASSPALENPPGEIAILEGLADATVLHVGLGVRVAPADPWTPNGPLLRVRTGAPIYVDPAAPPGGDGTTPDTATNDLPLAILTAYFVNGGGNIWLRGGEIGPLALPLYGGVFLSGGFDASLLLEQRNPVVNPSRLEGAVNEPIIQIQAGDGPAVIDGIVLDGRLEASAGVDDPGFPAELRSLVIRDCRRGIDLRAPPGGAPVTVLVTAVVVRDATVEGLRLEGPHHLWIESSSFRNCHNEGVALHDLIAPEFGSASLVIRASNFARNGEEGVDCHFAPPPLSGHGGGRFRIEVQDSDFQENARSGLVLDLDSEAFPEWTTQIEVRGCTSRANGLAGVHLDLDSTSNALVHRLTSSANGAEGVHVSSESWPGMATISCSVLSGNQGPGVRSSFGQVGVVLSHCVLSGNFGGGLAGEVAPAAATSCVAYIQPVPWSGALAIASPTQDLGLPEPFLRAAREYVGVVGSSGGALVLAGVPVLPPDGPVEIGDDGVARAVISLSGTRLELAPLPAGVALPGSAGFFSLGPSVAEDFELAPGSVAVDAGLAAPGAPAVDAGVFGSPLGGAPGRESPVPVSLFRLASTSPTWTQPLAPQETLELSFAGGNPDPSAAPSGVVVVDAQGNPLGAVAFVDGTVVRVEPPPGGWSAGQVLELFPALRSTDGRDLAVPVALPLR